MDNIQNDVPVEDLNMGPLYRAINDLTEYLHRNNNRTLKEEYDLVQARKSGLSKRLRELVIMLYETEKIQENEKSNDGDEKTV